MKYLIILLAVVIFGYGFFGGERNTVEEAEDNQPLIQLRNQSQADTVDAQNLTGNESIIIKKDVEVEDDADNPPEPSVEKQQGLERY